MKTRTLETAHRYPIDIRRNAPPRISKAEWRRTKTGWTNRERELTHDEWEKIKRERKENGLR